MRKFLFVLATLPALLLAAYLSANGEHEWAQLVSVVWGLVLAAVLLD